MSGWIVFFIFASLTKFVVGLVLQSSNKIENDYSGSFSYFIYRKEKLRLNQLITSNNEIFWFVDHNQNLPSFDEQLLF